MKSGKWDASEYNDMGDLSTPLHPSDTSPTSRTPLNRKDTASDSDIDTFITGETSSSGSIALRKLRDGWEKKVVARVRSESLPRSAQISIRKHPAAEIEPTKVRRGLWKDQLLVDRSLRTMSVLMSALALIMIIVVLANAKAFGARVNKSTSSVGGEARDCATVTRINTALLFIINIAATMILGMSNTYQQIITSLQTSDLKHMLQKFGDSRVGTNSPWNINHKCKGRVKSWAAWLLLVCTSLPIHFLANSLIGPSYIIEPPSSVRLIDETRSLSGLDDSGTKSSNSFLCWSAFRTGKASFSQSLHGMDSDLTSSNSIGSGHQSVLGVAYDEIRVSWTSSECSSLAGTWDKDLTTIEKEYTEYGDVRIYGRGKCRVRCSLVGEKPAKCRLNVRMNAACVLAVALTIKAIYMVTMNFLARGKIKSQLLTFGDVIVASASNTELRVQGECMVNAKESCRRHHSHKCHKHCKSKEESTTGEEIGHCQKCKKWNSVVRLTNEVQPTIATKLKRNLLSNLGNTALTQMALLIFCSILMVGASIAIAAALALNPGMQSSSCYYPSTNESEPSTIYYGPSLEHCQSASERLSALSGGWGGFNRSLPLTSLPADDINNETLSFLISNGAQFIYSLLYLLLIYNVTLVRQEHDWGTLERRRTRLRCTIVAGDSFDQSFCLQLPKRILFPIMTYSVLTHWMLGEALQTQENIWVDAKPDEGWFVEHSMYTVTFAAYPLWGATLLILAMTAACWWAFGYRREGVIPQMYGSVRVLCAAATCLDDFPVEGVMWGDLGMGKQFRHAGLSSETVQQIVPNELYAGEGVDGGGEEVDVEGGNECLRTARSKI